MTGRIATAPESAPVLSFFPPLGLLLVGCLLVGGIREQRSMRTSIPLASLPRTYDGIEGVDQKVPDDQVRIAAMTDYAMRSFGDDSNPKFSTFVAFYSEQMQGKAIHSPRNCLPGAGWEILKHDRVPLVKAGFQGTANQVFLANKNARALVYYWYQGRGRLEANEYLVKWNLLRDAMLLGRTDEALVRIVVPIDPRAGPAGETTAIRLAASVAQKLSVDVDAVLPR